MDDFNARIEKAIQFFHNEIYLYDVPECWKWANVFLSEYEELRKIYKAKDEILLLLFSSCYSYGFLDGQRQPSLCVSRHKLKK